MALTLKKGDRVRVKPGVGTDDMNLVGKIGVIDDVTDTDYWVEFPGVGEVQFFANELQKVKSLPATGEKAMALKWEKVGDELKSSDGRFVIWTLDGRNFSLDDKKYHRSYPAMSKTAKGCKQRAEMILAGEASRKSLSATETKAMALTWFKNGNEYRSLDGRWAIWGDDRRGYTLDHTLDDGERISWSVPGAFDSVEDAKKQAEKASRKSLPETRSTKSLELRAKYKGRASGVTIRENMNPADRQKLEAELRKLYTRLYDGDISVQMRIAYLEDRYPEMRTMVGRNW